MRFATMALKWALISLRISASLSFSTSKCSRVRSMYSRNRAPMARLSRSRAPLVLHGETANRWIDVLYEQILTCKSKTNFFLIPWPCESLMKCLTCHWRRLHQPAAQRCAEAGVSTGLAVRDASCSVKQSLIKTLLSLSGKYITVCN